MIVSRLSHIGEMMRTARGDSIYNTIQERLDLLFVNKRVCIHARPGKRTDDSFPSFQ